MISENCPDVVNFVSELKSQNGSANHTRVKRLVPKNPSSQHVHTYKKPDALSTEKLLEDRGWMFEQGDLERVFVIIIVLTILGEFVQSPTSSLADSGCLGHIGNDNIHKYGYQRSWGSVGFAVVSLATGAFVTTSRTHVTLCDVKFTMSDYRLAFYFFTGCMILVFTSTVMFKFSKQKDDKSNGKPEPEVQAAFKIFLSVHYGSWLFSAFFMGVCNGVIWSFLYWHLENIGASQLLIGIGSVIESVSETVMFFVIFLIFKRISYATFMALGILGYIARFVVFAVIDNPWWVLPVEVLQGFTFAGVWSALTAYICTAVSHDNLATMQGILHGVYWGLGSGSGAMLSGILVENYGARITFWIFAIGSAVNLVLFCTAQKV
ncbi:hypothetical protein FSP39_016477 [Pinctada imbricata]|uniref:Major facilitator superfamily associated domain-containing protein n=1 Tax=Pinctada imbricata TaxID=66713 RepID=A0AA88YNV1_PINIB|nr:hypothetical protein FSP39_016477 [Pinctada imbricata]